MIAIAVLLCLVVAARVYVDGVTPTQCTFYDFELKTSKAEEHRGYCVHPKQCGGVKEVHKPNWVCHSPTGRKLECCANYKPIKKPVSKNTVCGIRPSLKTRSGKMETEPIIGGVQAPRLSWPWMAAIYENRKFTCGGALISKNCILTAAHCFDGHENKPKNYYVRLGEHNLYVDTKDEYPEDIQASTVHVHPKFKVNCSDDDIAIIRLKTPSRLTPVCLPDKNKDAKIVGKNTVVTGWGTIKYDSKFLQPFSADLKEVSIPVKKTAYCEEHYKTVADYHKVFKKGIEDRRFICAGVEDGSRDACLGDSGGPLVLKVSPSAWHLVGIVCIGYGCGMKGYPGIYTRVTEYLPWIKRYCSN